MASKILDRPLYGAKPIGQAAHLFDEVGNVDMRKTYWALKRGYIDANKFGGTWISTLRRIQTSWLAGAK
jgi:hypothetical protein